ncbi:MAG: hypothetical protein ABWY78_06280 [Microvirga sp.]
MPFLSNIIKSAGGSTNTGGNSNNRFTRQYDDEEAQRQEAEAAAQEIQNRRPRDMTSFNPGWTQAFDAWERGDLASKMLSGQGTRMNLGGFGTGTSYKQGGQTVATRAPGGALRSLGEAAGSYGDVDQAAFNDALSRQISPYERMEKSANAAQDRAVAAAGALENPENDLYTGRAARRANQMAEIEGNANVVKFNREEPIRMIKAFEQRQRERELGYADPAVEKARLEADAKRREQAALAARSKGEAMKSFAKLAEVGAGIPEQIEEPDPTTGLDLGWLGVWGRQNRTVPNPKYTSHQAAMDELRNQIRPEGSGETEPVGELTMQDIAEAARQQGWSVQQAIEEAESRGYAVRR